MRNQKITWIKFLVTKSFIKHFIFSSVAIGVLLVGVLVYLNLYTNHNNTIELPDFTGVHIDEVDSFFTAQSLRYVVIDSIFNRDKEAGTVIDQDPKPGIHVKENRRIYLTTIAKKRQQVAMPYLIDLTHRSAMAKLKRIGLEIGDLSYVPNLAKNAVIKQKINGEEVKVGEIFPIGTKVDLVLGDGLSDVRVELPLLEGLSYQDAQMVLQLNSLNIGLAVFNENVIDSSKAIVYRQRPVAKEGRMIKLGSPVDVFLHQPLDKNIE